MHIWLLQLRDTEINVSAVAAFFHTFFLFVNNKNELFLNIKHTHHLSHICYTNKKCCSECFTLLILFLFQWNTIVNNQQFFPVNTDKEKGKRKNQLHRTMERKFNSFGVGLNMDGVQTLGLKHKEVFRQLLEQWDTCGQTVTQVRCLVLSHCTVSNDE